jgi:hypothetical protein
MAGGRPLVGPIYQDDIKVIACCHSSMEKDTLSPTILLSGFSRLWLVEDLQWLLFAKMISWMEKYTLFPTISLHSLIMLEFGM